MFDRGVLNISCKLPKEDLENGLLTAISRRMTDQERFPRYFIDLDIDRRKCERTVPMKVLVIGMLRTGTLSNQIPLAGTHSGGS